MLSDDHARTAYDQQLQEQARFRAMQRQSLKVKLTPTTSGWNSALQFYVTEFPFALASLVLYVMDAQLFLMLLVCVGCAVFVLDFAIRVCRTLGDALFSLSSQSIATQRSNDAAMKAARLRQQQALDANARLAPQRPSRKTNSRIKK